jgi:REP element-mobilizing transposase RayT
MANTYTQLHIHAVFAVQNRASLIRESWKEELYKYISGIIQTNGHKLLAINGMPDHVHVFFGMRPVQSLSDLMQDVKSGSSRWVDDNQLVKSKFSWQEGYGAFSYSKSQVPKVINYIQNQEYHHAKKTFLDEYRELLDIFDIDYDERYIFKPIE